MKESFKIKLDTDAYKIHTQMTMCEDDASDALKPLKLSQCTGMISKPDKCYCGGLPENTEAQPDEVCNLCLNRALAVAPYNMNCKLAKCTENFKEELCELCGKNTLTQNDNATKYIEGCETEKPPTSKQLWFNCPIHR